MRSRYVFFGGTILCLEALSFLTFDHPWANTSLALLLTAILFVLAIRKPTLALSFLSLEYLIGSLGGLFRAFGDGEGHGGLSIRILLFVAFFAGWLVRLVLEAGWKGASSRLRQRVATQRVWLLVMGLAFYGSVLGLIRGQSNVWLDANAWGVLLLVFPLVDIIERDPDGVRCDLIPAVITGLLWLPLKTLFVAYYFSHGFGWGGRFYFWIRQTGVGEITRLVGFIPRVFFQSHVYALITVLLIAAWWSKNERGARWIRWLAALSLAVLILSLSRSFWLGLFVGSLSLLCLLIRRSGLRSLIAPLREGTRALLMGSALIFVALFFPFPPVAFDSFTSALTSRFDLSDGAARSRWELLPAMWNKILEHPLAGSGFGATVTYRSADPRQLASPNGGVYTTYAFEWGWLDFWIKFGVAGLLIMSFVLFDLIRRTWRSTWPDWLKIGVTSSLVALLTVHFFTPYLNHPLGFFALFVVEGWLSLQPRVTSVP